MASQVLSSEREFVCSSFAGCRRSALLTSGGQPRKPPRDFWRGQLSHVGEHYDLCEDSRPLRVVFIGMEVGRADEFITLAERRAQQEVAIFDQTFRSRRPHMKGTTSALRVLFGRGVGSDAASEWLDVGGTEFQHLMDCYALLNLRLCSSVISGTTSSAGTPVMDKNCLPHLAATIAILEPTVVVLQGSGIRPAIAKELRTVARLDPQLPLERVVFSGVTTILASFPHPYQQGRNSHMNWGSSDHTPYLLEVVAPTLSLAREISRGSATNGAAK